MFDNSLFQANLHHGFGSPRGIFTSALPASGHHLVSGEEQLSNVHKAGPQSIHKGSNSAAVSHIRGICTMTQQEINCLSFPVESCNSKICYTELFFRFTQSKQQILLGLSSAAMLLQLFIYFLNIACSDRKVTTMIAQVFFQTGVKSIMWGNNHCNRSDTQLSILLATTLLPSHLKHTHTHSTLYKSPLFFFSFFFFLWTI